MGVTATPKFELELAGLGGGWTNVTADVRMAGFGLRYGIEGAGPADRVASPGALRFVLDNSTANSGGLLGYYSPNHANKRAGFGLGIRVRYSLNYSGSDYYKFIGTIDSIDPVPGQKGSRATLVTAVDYMDDLARFRISGLPTVLNTTAGAVIEQVRAAMPTQPNAYSFSTGADVYPYAMANAASEKVYALAEMQRVALSELGLLVIRGSTTAAQAGKLTFYGRNDLVQSPLNVSQATFSDSMVHMDSAMGRDRVINKLQMRVHPRTVDTSGTTLLWTLQSEPGSEPAVDLNQTITILGKYSDPALRAARIGGHTVSVSVSVNTRSDGSGSDLSGFVTIDADAGSDGVRIVVTNTPGDAQGNRAYVSAASASGYGIYDYEPLDAEASNSASITANGERSVGLDQWYITDTRAAKVQGDYLISFWSTATTFAESLTIFASSTDALMLQALGLEPGDLITVAETVTGINRVYRIQSVELTMPDGKNLVCTWGLSPQADTTLFMLLDTVNRAELDTNARLAA